MPPVSSSPPLPELPGVKHSYVDAAGTTFHIAEAGEGDPVLLVHGWPQHWWAWRKIIPLLAQNRRVICMDLRGFGWSEATSGKYAKQQLADDIVAVLDALELDRVDLIAHDWGAWASFLACLKHPHRFKHYVALNIITPWPNPPRLSSVLQLWRITYQFILATPLLGTTLLKRSSLIPRMIKAGRVQKDAWTREDLALFGDALRPPRRAKASQQLYRTFLLREVGPYIAGKYRGQRLTVPTVMIHGTKDLAIDVSQLGQWERYADDMALELRDDSGHFIPEELPEVIADRATKLFDGASPRDVAQNQAEKAEA